jgi:hypothetical protein
MVLHADFRACGGGGNGTDDENRALGRVDEPGGYAPEQQPSAPCQSTGPDHDEVLGIFGKVAEERLEDLAVEGDRLHDAHPESESPLPKLFE